MVIDGYERRIMSAVVVLPVLLDSYIMAQELLPFFLASNNRSSP